MAGLDRIIELDRNHANRSKRIIIRDPDSREVIASAEYNGKRYMIGHGHCTVTFEIGPTRIEWPFPKERYLLDYIVSQGINIKRKDIMKYLSDNNGRPTKNI